MRDFLLVLFASAMLALWVIACISSRRQSRSIRQVTFLLGTFICCPALSFALFTAMTESALGDIDKPTGSGVLAIFTFAVVASFALWFAGFWIASALGWWLRKPSV